MPSSTNAVADESINEPELPSDPESNELEVPHLQGDTSTGTSAHNSDDAGLGDAQTTAAGLGVICNTASSSDVVMPTVSTSQGPSL